MRSRNNGIRPVRVIEVDVAHSLAGLGVGFVIGLTGIGGGALMTPILLLGFNVAPLVAVSTDLLYAAITKSGGIWNYARSGLVRYSIVVLMLCGSLPASWVALQVLSLIDTQMDIERVINLTLGLSLVLTSIAVFMRLQIQGLALALAETSYGAVLRRWRPYALIVAAALLGVLVTLSSVGAGALGTAILILLYPRLSMAQIVGTDLLHAVVLTAVAGLGHYQMGTVDLSLLAALLVGSLPGVWLGSYLGARLSPRVMQPVMGSLLMAIGLRFVLAG